MADESHPQSDDSPGVVRDEETLLRVVFHPEHIKDGQVIETAIPLEDLQSRGFSVDRYGYAQRTVLQTIIDRQMARRPDVREEGTLAVFLCRGVRQLRDVQETRAFLVIDTACPTHVSHASIYAAQHGTRSYLRKLRSILLPLLQHCMSLADIFAG
jgi:hypothetical protein